MVDNTAIYVCMIFPLILLSIAILLSKRINYFRKLSETDQMTSLMNYRGLCRNIEKLIKYKIPFSLAIIDIDDFRMFNKHSYKLGDDVLKEFASLLKHFFSENVMLARFRIGDEFIIVFQNTNLQKAKIKIAELKEKCKNFNFISLKNFSLNTVKFSEGISEINSETSSIDFLFSEAENALKLSKSENNHSNN